EASITILGADQGVVQRYDPVTRTLNIVVQHGFAEDFLEHFRVVGLADGSAGSRAMESRTQVLIEDVESDPEYAPHRAVAASAGYRAVLATPLLGRDGDVIAVLSTCFREPHRPSDR